MYRHRLRLMTPRPLPLGCTENLSTFMTPRLYQFQVHFDIKMYLDSLYNPGVIKCILCLYMLYMNPYVFSVPIFSPFNSNKLHLLTHPLDLNVV